MKARAFHLRISVSLLAGLAGTALAVAATLSGGNTNGDPDPCVNGGMVDAAPCGFDIGECKTGVLSCDGGHLHCEWTGPTPEVCNGKDDDCNGIMDDPDQLDGLPCTSAGDAGDRMHGQCLGTSQCTGGVPSCVQCDDKGICHPAPPPSIEVCDGEDNDCDGVVDNDNANGFPLCFGGEACVSGPNIPAQCAPPCDHGEFTNCPRGTVCLPIGPDASDSRYCIATGDLGEPCSDSRLCKSTFCADGVCCDQACDGGCMACTAELKGPNGGADGTCGPLTGRPPDNRCTPCKSSFECPINSVCSERGDCIPPAPEEPTVGCSAARAGSAGASSFLVIAALLCMRPRRRKQADQGAKMKAS